MWSLKPILPGSLLQSLYRFEELGIGASVLHELQNTEVIELELELAAAATRNKTRDVFEPYPAFLLKNAEMRNRSGFFGNCSSGGQTYSPNMANKNLDLLEELISSFPPLSEMQNCSSESELVLKLGMSWQKKVYKSTGKISTIGANLSPKDFVEKMWLPYKILRFVLFTNRLLLRLLPESHRLNIDEFHYQFAVFYNSEREQNFEQRRETEGSIFAFHGSNISNWYSIVRNGLKCLSDTKYMSSGKAYGAGIYFSTEMSYSYHYATSIEGYGVLALCEIFSGARFSTHNNSFFLVPPGKENKVVIRYLLVWKNRMIPPRNACSVTGGHLLSGNTNLHKHYEQLRRQFLEEWSNDY